MELMEGQQPAEKECGGARLLAGRSRSRGRLSEMPRKVVRPPVSIESNPHPAAVGSRTTYARIDARCDRSDYAPGMSAFCGSHERKRERETYRRKVDMPPTMMGDHDDHRVVIGVKRVPSRVGCEIDGNYISSVSLPQDLA